MTDTPCEFCRYPFDQEATGRYGCPNCHGEGLGLEEAMTETKPIRVVIVDGMRHSAAYLVAALAALEAMPGAVVAGLDARREEETRIREAIVLRDHAPERTEIRYTGYQGPRTKGDRHRDPKWPRRRR